MGKVQISFLLTWSLVREKGCTVHSKQGITGSNNCVSQPLATRTLEVEHEPPSIPGLKSVRSTTYEGHISDRLFQKTLSPFRLCINGLADSVLCCALQLSTSLSTSESNRFIK